VNKDIFYPDKKIKKEDYVVSIGRLQLTKGVQYLIEACELAGKKLRFISSECKGETARLMRGLIDDYYENIPQTEVADLLRRSRVYVCPSLSERQSLGVLEAASCGLPVVDSIFNRGYTFLSSSKVIDPRNVKELAKAINEQWDSPPNTDRVPTWEDVAKELIKLYESIL